MPITYPLSLPAQPGFVDFAWEPESVVQVQESEFTYQQKVYAWEGKRRKASVTVGPIVDIGVAKAWQAALLKLNGPEGTFYLQDPIGAEHRGAYVFSSGSSPKVMGGSQNGPDLVTDGWPNSVTGLLLTGDYIAIQGRLYQLLEDANSNGSGESTLLVWPHATFKLLNNADITVGLEAFGLFRLIEAPSQPWNVEKIMENLTFGCMEAF